MSTEPKYPEVSVQLTGENGNAFVIIGTVTAALRKGRVPEEQIEKYMAEAMAGDYDNLLRVTMAWVDVN